MKHLLFTLALVILTSPVHAGSMSFTCKNSDNSLIVTRDKMVLLQKDESKQESLTIMTNQSGDMPAVGETHTFLSADSSDISAGTLNFKSVGRSTVISKSGGDCKGGHTPGHETASYRVRAELWLYGQKHSDVRMRCTETHTWGGNCDFGDNPEGTPEGK